MNLYVSNLGDQITDESLRAVFATYGEVRSSTISKDDAAGDPGRFGFVEMPDEMQAQNAINRLNGTIVNGRFVSVKEAAWEHRNKERSLND
jgi:RNA recognition motif-containing protein